MKRLHNVRAWYIQTHMDVRAGCDRYPPTVTFEGHFRSSPHPRTNGDHGASSTSICNVWLCVVPRCRQAQQRCWRRRQHDVKQFLSKRIQPCPGTHACSNAHWIVVLHSADQFKSLVWWTAKPIASDKIAESTEHFTAAIRSYTGQNFEIFYNLLLCWSQI